MKYGYEFIPMKKAQLRIYSIEQTELRYGWGQPRPQCIFSLLEKVPERHLHNLTKYEISGTSISPVYQLFIVNIVNYTLLLLLFIVNWGKFGSAAQAYAKKTQFFIFFMNWKKLRSPARAKFKNSKIYKVAGCNVTKKRHHRCR